MVNSPGRLAEHLRLLASMIENANTPSKWLNILMMLGTALEYARLEAFQSQMRLIKAVQNDIDPVELGRMK